MTGGVISANTTTNALRITQTGLGNALLVEDNTNPDATSFLIDSNGTIVIGASAASTKNLSRKGFQFVTNTYAPSRIIELRSHAVTVPGPELDFNAQLDFVRTNSGDSNDYSTSFILSPYDALGGITFKGGNSTGTSIYCQNKYNSFSGNVSGSILTIRNHVASTNSLYSILTLDENKAGIGTLTPNEALTVVGNISATGSLYGNGSNLTGIVAGDSVATTLVRTNSANWNSVYTSVKDTSANWNSVYTSVKGTSANWDSVYTTYNKNSAECATIQFANNKFLPLSGGIVTGDLTVDNILQIGDGNPNFDFIVTEEGNVGINTETPNEALTVVGNISATQDYFSGSNKSVFTPQTNTVGVSAVTNIVAVSALPVFPDPSTLYIVI